MYRLFFALLMAAAVVRGHGQFIPFQSFASGSDRVSGSQFVLSGAFGQPIAHSEDNVALKGGIMAGSLFFLSGNLPPIITFDSTVFALLDKQARELKADIFDRDGLAAKEFHYRPIASASFVTVPMALDQGDKYKVTIQTTWLDRMGMEYFITAKDVTGKASRYPATGYMHGFAAVSEASVPSEVYRVYATGNQQQQYRIITIPYDMTGHANISEQFDEVTDYSKGKFRMATFNNASSNFLEYPETLNRFTRGVGYWFLTREAVNFKLSNITVPREFRAKLFEIALRPGWNQIGNPYTEPIAWEDVREFNAGVTMNAIKTYHGAYQDGDIINPFEGGFVFLTGAATTIKIPLKGQTSPGGRRLEYKFSNDISQDQWMLRLNLNDGLTKSSIAAIGMHPDASSGIDPFDDFYPPRFFDFAEIHFHPPGINTVVAKDITTRREENIWSFDIDASTSQLDLEWDNRELGLNPFDLYLYDVANARVINMRELNAYRVVKDGAYRMYYGIDIRHEIVPDKPALGKPFPNPLSARSGDVTIPFAMPESKDLYKVQLDIVDAQGRIVRTLVQQPLAPGFHEARWNGADQRNEACAAGLYLCKLSIVQDGVNVNYFERILIAQ